MSSGSSESRSGRRRGTGYFQHVVYRLVPADGAPGPGVRMPLGLVALNSDVLSPADGQTISAGPVEVRGYASRAGIVASRASTFHSTTAPVGLRHSYSMTSRWAWRHWRITIDLSPGEHEILVRAWDSSAVTQPEHAKGLWNPKNYVNNACPPDPGAGHDHAELRPGQPACGVGLDQRCVADRWTVSP